LASFQWRAVSLHINSKRQRGGFSKWRISSLTVRVAAAEVSPPANGTGEIAMGVYAPAVYMVGLLSMLAINGCGQTPTDSAAIRSPTAKTRIELDSQIPGHDHGRDPVIQAAIKDLTDNPREAKTGSPISKE
jgi:hypothetical protein